MSSPFATFRKNQQFWMAALVLVAILAFVVAPAIETIMRSLRGGGVDNTVYVSWDGGRMTRDEVNRAMQKRNQFVGFLHALGKKVLENGGVPAVPGFSQSANGDIQNLGVDSNVSPDRVCMGRILAEHAERMGIRFDDHAADEFLRSFLDQKVTDQEYRDILRKHTDGLTDFDVRELIKQELALQIIERVASGVQAAIPPGKTWQDFLKLSQTAKAEAYPVFLSEYASKVTEQPAESEIQEIFEQGKTYLSSPYSEEPGFLKPPQANAEYVELKFQDWVEREKAKLTEEEIKAEYDRKAELKLLEVPVEEPKPESTDGTEPSAPATEEESAPSAEPPASEPEPATEPTSEGESSAAATEGGETPPDDSAPGESSAPSEPDTATGPDTTVEPPADGSQVSNSPLSKVRFVSLQQESTQEAPAQEAPAGTTEPPAEIPSEPGAQEPPTETSTETPSSEPTALESDAPADPATPEPPKTRTKTFEEAREEIVNELARTKVQAAATPVIEKLEAIMQEYSLSYRQYETFKNASADDKNVKNMEMPTRPDIKKFAEENGFAYGETGLGNSAHLAGSKFGGSNVMMEGMRSIGQASDVLPLAQLESFKPFQSTAGVGVDDYSLFLFWKTDSRPPVVPALSEVRDQVVAAWKNNKAKQLANDAALELSKKLEAAGGQDPWAVLPDTLKSLVITTDPFTWLSRVGMQITATNVPKLDAVGEEFMRQVFTTEVNKFGVSPNESKSVYYVFRVIEKAPSTEELRSRFEADQFKFGPASVANIEHQQATQNWRSRIFADLNVKFEG